MKSEKFKVDGMTCNHCVNAIQNALKEIGVKGVVDLKNKTVEVNFTKEEFCARYEKAFGTKISLMF